MLTYLHQARTRYREDAYRDYCYNVDVYGGFEPASFIYLCFESFAEKARNYGIDLRCRRRADSNHKPIWFPDREQREGVLLEIADCDGLLARSTGDPSLEAIQEFLSDSKNVLLLLPNEYYSFVSKPEDVTSRVSDFLHHLGAGHLTERFTPQRLSNTADVWWEEIAVPRGRLLITIDSHISDGMFLEHYGFSGPNSRAIDDLLREFATQRRQIVTITPRNRINTWPCLEPATLVFDVRNHGPVLDSLRLSIDTPSEFELAGSPEIELPTHSSLATSSFAIQLVLRVSGYFESAVQVSALDAGIILRMTPVALTVTPKFSTQLREQSPRDSEGFARLKAALGASPLIDPDLVKTLEQLSRVDPAVCLNKIRSAVEHLCRRVSGKAGLGLYQQIQLIQNNKLMSQKAVGYLHTLRVLGNLASHPSGEHLGDGDVRLASFALACVIDEFALKPSGKRPI